MNNTIIELDLDNSIIKEESLTIPKVEYLLRLKPSESKNNFYRIYNIIFSLKKTAV